jgi:Helix-turn-helix of DDE superfamily endonuclease/DDE superfamily endonuclease
MLNYDKLKDKPREFLAATGLTLAEFACLLPAFQHAYDTTYPPDLTYEGKTRQRRTGGGAKGTLASIPDKLVFLLVYQKTNPLQVMHGLQFELSQAQAHYWIHRLLPVLQHAWRDMGQAPERDAHRVETSALAVAGAPTLAGDGTERRRQRPRDATQQKAHYSGKKKTHTDKHILLVNEQTGKVVYLGPTLPGKPHDKKAADAAEIAYRVNTTLDKDTGFQGYEPERVLTTQPQKSPKAKSSR